MAVPVFATILTILYAVVTFELIRLFISNYFKNGNPCRKRSDKEKATNPSITRTIFTCVLFYMTSAIMAVIVLILFLFYGWIAGGITENVFWVFSFFYTVSLFLLIYVWIERLETTFIGSAYAPSKRTIKLMKYAFISIIILGFGAGGATAGQGDTSREADIVTYIVWILASLFMIVFLGLLFSIIYLFISKLNVLRKVAQDRLMLINAQSDIDLDSLIVIQKLVKLQLKITISAVISISSTIILIILTVMVFDKEGEVICLGIDAIIGFVCVHVTIKSHNEFYEKLCKICIISCDCCFKTTELNVEMDKQIMVHSKSTKASGTFNSGNSGNSGEETTKASHKTKVSGYPQSKSGPDSTQFDKSSDNKSPSAHSAGGVRNNESTAMPSQQTTHLQSKVSGYGASTTITAAPDEDQPNASNQSNLNQEDVMLNDDL